MAGRRPVILDTCALLWLVQGGGELSKGALRSIGDAAAVYVSAISGFEIGIKVAKGKLHLPARPLEWFSTALEHHAISLVSLDLAVCIRATELPAIHSDPCDRMIIATAQAHGLAVVTTDSVFSKYDVKVIA